jgi:hypothetical protein
VVIQLVAATERLVATDNDTLEPDRPVRVSHMAPVVAFTSECFVTAFLSAGYTALSGLARGHNSLAQRRANWKNGLHGAVMAIRLDGLLEGPQWTRDIETGPERGECGRVYIPIEVELFQSVIFVRYNGRRRLVVWLRKLERGRSWREIPAFEGGSAVCVTRIRG